MTKDTSNKKQQLILKIKTSGKDIAIFGAGVAGEALYHLCSDAGIEVKCFCDNNTNKAGRKINGIPVCGFTDVTALAPNPLFLISVADIFDVVEQMQVAGFEHWYGAEDLLDEFDVKQYPFSVPNDFAEYVVSTCVECHRAFSRPNALFMRSVDIVITERCSLKCRDCANLMQYYQKPKNYSLERVLEDSKRLAKVVESVNEVRVIGGEPLMNAAFTSMVRHLIDENKFRRVIIYTNGTICPSEERLKPLKHSKLLFFITNNGKLSKNLARLKERLNKLDIQHHVQDAQGWTKCSTLYMHHRDEDENNVIFNECCAKNLTTLMNGVLYRCPFSANAEILGAVRHHSEDSVLINNNEDLTSRERHKMKKQIMRLLSKKTPLQVCDYCEGRPLGAPEIEPAIQIKDRLKYDKLAAC